MISGDVLKYRNGFLIRECYETVISGSSEFPLTLPPAVMKAALHKHCPVNVFTTQAGIEINEHWTVRPLDK